MKTEALKINVAQRILSISDDGLLQKIKNLLDKENVFAYDSDGNPITGSDYIKNLDAINEEIDTKKAKLYSTNDVLRRVADDNKLAL
jgi:tRNA A37 N6-isopentenylltransferase MiaA